MKIKSMNFYTISTAIKHILGSITSMARELGSLENSLNKFYRVITYLFLTDICLTRV